MLISLSSRVTRSVIAGPLLMLLLTTVASGAPMRVATLPIPGHTAFVRTARDILDVYFAVDGSNASQAGLMDDAARVPDFSPAGIAAFERRLDTDKAALRALPWRKWPVDEQIDIRFMYAVAQQDLHELRDERLFTHRPAQWLESVSNNFANIFSYAPTRIDVRTKLEAQIPAMVTQMRAVCTNPTQHDVTTALGLVDGLKKTMAFDPASPQRDAADTALDNYATYLKTLHPTQDYAVIGAANYAWRLRHIELLPWTPDQLLALAQREKATVDAQLAALKPNVVAPKPTAAQINLAKVLNQQRLLALYDAIEQDHFRVLRTLNIITIPAGVGPIHARVTPDAMLAFGDGGSMNPPATYAGPNIGFWNVEHFKPSMSQDDRIQTVVDAQDFNLTGMGPYSVHEGVPGHHLQLSIARLNPDPLRSIIEDPVQNEGWALYAEDEFWRSGGLGNSVNAHYNTLRSWLFRVKRVYYDVNVETGRWTLQQAADFQQDAAPGKGKIGGDVTRAINWPAQLICYFSGKEQILALKAAYKKKLGKAYTERKFNDALLSLGSVPYVFARAKMLSEPVPNFD